MSIGHLFDVRQTDSERFSEFPEFGEHFRSGELFKFLFRMEAGSKTEPTWHRSRYSIHHTKDRGEEALRRLENKLTVNYSKKLFSKKISLIQQSNTWPLTRRFGRDERSKSRKKLSERKLKSKIGESDQNLKLKLTNKKITNENR